MKSNIGIPFEILIKATPRDLRLARICVASVRHYHLDARVRILPGAPLPAGVIREMIEHWDVDIFPMEHREYGWGFVSLEPLFQKEKSRFLILDSDTILLGPMAQLFEESEADFLVDDEGQPEAEMKRLYYDWDKVQEADSEALRPKFVFNGVQWFGTSGLLNREDFSPLVEWTFPRRLREPDVFKTWRPGNPELHCQSRTEQRKPDCGSPQNHALDRSRVGRHYRG